MKRSLSDRQLLLVCALFITIGPFSLHIYTPAMPELAAVFGVSAALIQSTITSYLLTLALGQLFSGPLSDAFGRRPVLIWFQAIYFFSSLLMVFAASAEWILAGRLLQGVGSAAGITVARAIVRDRFEGQASLRALAWIGTMIAVLPAVSPLLGSLILELAGWRATFLAMTLFGAVSLAAAFFLLPETNRDPDPAKVRPAEVMQNYLLVLRSRRFRGCCLTVGLIFGTAYTILALLPFILIGHFGFSATQFGLVVLMNATIYMVGSAVITRLSGRLSPVATIKLALAVAACAAAWLLARHLAGALLFFDVMIAAALWGIVVSFALPGATTLALADQPQIAGSASAVIGAVQIGGGFVLNALTALFFADHLTAMAVMLPIVVVLVIAGLPLLSGAGSR